MQKTILLSPLDWGLGHTTRCLPLIKALLEMQCKVVVATSGAPATILRQNFGDSIQYEDLKGYEVEYSRRRVMLSIIAQLPRIRRSIRYERHWLQQKVPVIRPDAIISDNRYGFYHEGVPSVIISHQLQLPLPKPWQMASPLVQASLNGMLRHFDEIWIPDVEDTDGSLAGLLSHPVEAPGTPLSYIGHLSQLPELPTQEKAIDVLVVLSGPEPQRTILEKKIIDQYDSACGKMTIVRGLPNDQVPFKAKAGITVKSFAGAKELAALAQSSRYLLCRSGYSSLMDFLPLGAKCLLVPTPGQTEQEYLAARLQKINVALMMEQQEFNLPALLRQARLHQFAAFPLPKVNSLLSKTLNTWLSGLR